MCGRPRTYDLRYDDELRQVGLSLPGRVIMRLDVAAKALGVSRRALIQAMVEMGFAAADDVRPDVVERVKKVEGN